jgi:CBS domain-containing protein
MKVAQVMTREVVAVRPETPLKGVAALMVSRGISGVPVVDADGSVLGVVSEADFVIKEGGPEAVPHRLLARIVGESSRTLAQLAKIAARTAGEAMTSPAITIRADDPLRVAAERMAYRKINRLPVVEEGRLVGIVTRADLVRAYLRPDAELARLVREEVFAQTAYRLEPESVVIEVKDGVVHLEGRVERRSLAETIVDVIRDLSGVVGTTSNLSWEIDDVAGSPLGELASAAGPTLRPH